MRAIILAAWALLMLASPAAAYIGPGVGAGAIAVVLGVLASLVMAVFAILWYPVKRLVRRRRASALPNAEAADARGK